MLCTIKIDDEVNCKLQNLELRDRKTLMRKFEFEVPGARFLPSVRLGRWSGKTSFFSLGGTTFINLLPEIIPLLDAAGYTIELEDTRTYQTSFEFDKIDENSFSSKVWPEKHPLEGKPIILRDYQVSIINDFLMNPQCMVEAATGSGKTIVTAALSSCVERYGRSIIIVPNVSLVTQTEADYRNMGLDVGVYYGGRKEAGHQHTICTWQSMNSIYKNSTEGNSETISIEDFIKDVICVIVDECHQAKATALKTLLTGPLSKIPIRWGLTGTIPKEPMDKCALLVSVGSVISKLSASDLQEQGVLANCHVDIIQMQDDVEFKTYPAELKFLTEDTKRIKEIAKIVHGLISTGNTLVLINRIESGNMLLAELKQLTENVVFVSGTTKETSRAEEYGEIATTSNKILICTYGVAAVGINIPRLFNVVLVEPGKSFVRTIQSIGRGLRLAEDKTFVQITDITSNCKFSKRHLTSRKQFYTEAKYPFSVKKIKYKL